MAATEDRHDVINNDTVKVYYNEFRDAELNKEYYAVRMAAIKRKLKYVNIFLAIFAGTSAVVSFSFWHYEIFGIPVGSLSLGALTGIAVILSIAMPYLGLETDIERVSSIQGVYSVLSSLHKDNVMSIITEKKITEKEKMWFDLMRRMRISLDPKEDKPSDKKLVDEMQAVVNRRYPKEFFWYPEKK